MDVRHPLISAVGIDQEGIEIAVQFVGTVLTHRGYAFGRRSAVDHVADGRAGHLFHLLQLLGCILDNLVILCLQAGDAFSGQPVLRGGGKGFIPFAERFFQCLHLHPLQHCIVQHLLEVVGKVLGRAFALGKALQDGVGDGVRIRSGESLLHLFVQVVDHSGDIFSFVLQFL